MASASARSRLERCLQHGPGPDKSTYQQPAKGSFYWQLPPRSPPRGPTRLRPPTASPEWWATMPPADLGSPARPSAPGRLHRWRSAASPSTSSGLAERQAAAGSVQLRPSQARGARQRGSPETGPASRISSSRRRVAGRSRWRSGRPVAAPRPCRPGSGPCRRLASWVVEADLGHVRTVLQDPETDRVCMAGLEPVGQRV
jgi:hypothetical protein